MSFGDPVIFGLHQSAVFLIVFRSDWDVMCTLVQKDAGHRVSFMPQFLLVVRSLPGRTTEVCLAITNALFCLYRHVQCLFLVWLSKLESYTKA